MRRFSESGPPAQRLPRTLPKVFCTLVSGVLLAFVGTWGADQPEKTMLIEEISGHRYERTSFDSGGGLVGRGILVVGEVRSGEGMMTVPITFETYQPDGNLEERSEATWTCNPLASKMVMTLLLLAGEDLSPRLKLEASGPPILFPRRPGDGEKLPDISLALEIEKGVPSFLGARSRITISDRRVETPPSSEGPSEAQPYRIHSEIEIKAFVLGIRIKRIRLQSEELIDPSRGLLRQVLTRKDGSSIDIKAL